MGPFWYRGRAAIGPTRVALSNTFHFDTMTGQTCAFDFAKLQEAELLELNKFKAKFEGKDAAAKRAEEDARQVALRVEDSRAVIVINAQVGGVSGIRNTYIYICIYMYFYIFIHTVDALCLPE